MVTSKKRDGKKHAKKNSNQTTQKINQNRFEILQETGESGREVEQVHGEGPKNLNPKPLKAKRKAPLEVHDNEDRPQPLEKAYMEVEITKD